VILSNGIFHPSFFHCYHSFQSSNININKLSKLHPCQHLSIAQSIKFPLAEHRIKFKPFYTGHFKEVNVYECQYFKVAGQA